MGGTSQTEAGQLLASARARDLDSLWVCSTSKLGCLSNGAGKKGRIVSNVAASSIWQPCSRAPRLRLLRQARCVAARPMHQEECAVFLLGGRGGAAARHLGFCVMFRVLCPVFIFGAAAFVISPL
jgi:hypothetical protein